MDDATRILWLEARRSGIGGSEAAAILGTDPWQGPYSVYQSKISPIGDNKAVNDAMYWGTVLENTVAEEFARRTGFLVAEDYPRVLRGKYELLRSKKWPFMHASIDRWICTQCTDTPEGWDKHNNECDNYDSFLECKTARQGKEAEWDEGVPPNYYAQVQHYMAVTDMQFCFVACLIGGSTYITHKVLRNEEFIRNLVGKEADFWTLVVNKTPPPADASEDTTAILNRQRATEGHSVDLAGPYTFGLIHALKDVKATIASLESKKTGLENQIKAALADAEFGYVDGRCVVTWKPQSKSTIDGKGLWEKHPDIAKAFSKVSTYRVLRVQDIETAE